MGTAMEFGLLGPLEVARDGVRLPVRAAKQRALLASLLVDANRVVTADELIRRLWGSEPPVTPRNALQNYVLRLRQLLTGDGQPAPVVTRHDGYLIEIDEDALDLHRFDGLVRRGTAASAAGDHARAAVLLDDALRLWRGEALQGVPSEALQRDVASALEERRLLAIESRIGADLATGRHAEVISELAELTARHQFRERLWAQRLTALYRCGRQADALECYRTVQRLLADELGIDPGPELRRLHQAVLTSDPALALPPPGIQPADDPGPRAVGTQQPEAPAATRPVPRQLPADVAKFTGRSDHMRLLDSLLADGLRHSGGTVLISAIEGIAGVGKTALALHWAHRAASDMPDGQLYVNLRGYAQSPPMEPAEALARFLRALGVPQEQIPVDGDEQAAMYRSLVADKRMLVLLDNAATAGQVRPLLPGSSGCLVLITSRGDLRGLAALEGAHRLVLDVLAPEEAISLLTRTIGDDRSATEADHVARLAELCGYLPLALRIAGAHLASHPAQTVRGYVAQVSEGDRLSQLGIEHDQQAAVRASFDLSYQTLPSDAARLFRLLGLVPGPDFAAPAAAALAGLPERQTSRLLGGLAAVHLLECPSPGRFQFHDLIRLYAAERAQSIDGKQDIDRALRRLFSWYLHSTGAATKMLYPEIESLPGTVEDDVHPLGFGDIADAITWLETERPGLLASVRHATLHGPRSMSWRLGHALRGYFYTRMVLPDWMESADLGLEAANLDDDIVGQATMLHSRAHAHFCLSSYEQALGYEARALQLAQQAGDQRIEAEIVKWSGLACVFLGRLAESVEHLTRALDLYRRTGNLHGEVNAHIGLGQACKDMGRFDDALRHYDTGLALSRQVRSRYGEALSLHCTGVVYSQQGRFTEAQDLHAQALKLYQEVGTRYHESSVSYSSAVILCCIGSYEQAAAEAEHSRALSRETGDRRTEAHALNTLGTACTLLRRFDDAAGYHESALRLARKTGTRMSETQALIGLAGAHLGVGRYKEGILSGQAGLRAARQSGLRPCEADALVTLAELHTHLRQRDRAVTYGRQALEIFHGIGHPLGQARALRALGSALYDHDPQSAIARWRQAMAVFTHLGTPEADQLRALTEMPAGRKG